MFICLNIIKVNFSIAANSMKKNFLFFNFYTASIELANAFKKRKRYKLNNPVLYQWST